MIFKCILGLQSQSIDFTNEFSQEDIPSGDPVLIELPRDSKSYGGQCDAVIRLKKSLYSQLKAAQLWYENVQNGLLESIFVARKVDLCMIMSKAVICVVYVYDFTFWHVHNLILIL